MTKDEIIAMAKEAGFNWPEILTTTIEERLERFYNLAYTKGVQDERKARIEVLRSGVERDAQQPADVEVVFIDGVGAGRSSIKSCRDGVQWIRVGGRIYWPLSDADAKRLQSACCGNGSFDGPAMPAGEGKQASVRGRVCGCHRGLGRANECSV